jgi:sugar phosphate permease
LCYPLAAMVSGPIAGYVLTFGTWRTLFIIEGLFPIVWAVVWLWGAADTPQSARWLAPADRAALVAHLARETPAPTTAIARTGLWAEMARTPVMLFTIAIFFWNIGFLGFIIWLPSVIAQGHDLSPLAIGWLSAAPFAASIVAMQVLTFWSDRRQDRRRVATFAVVVCGLTLVIGGMTFGTNTLGMNMVLLIVAGAMLYGSQPVLWSMPAEMLPGGVAGMVMGAINGFGVLGAFVGPYVVGFVRGWTNSFAAGLWVMGLCLLVAGLLIFCVRASAPPAFAMASGAAAD